MGINEQELERFRAEQELYERAINGDVDACILWLTSRRPEEWKMEYGQEPHQLDGD